MQSFILYGTSACHLCEQAEELLAALLDPTRHQIELVDISEEDVLVERYGVRIPVLLREADGAELGWPFDAEQANAFLKG